MIVYYIEIRDGFKGRVLIVSLKISLFMERYCHTGLLRTPTVEISNQRRAMLGNHLRFVQFYTNYVLYTFVSM